MIKRYCTPLAVALVAIGLITTVSAATTPRGTQPPDPATTGAFVQLAQRAGATEVSVRPAGAVRVDAANR